MEAAGGAAHRRGHRGTPARRRCLPGCAARVGAVWVQPPYVHCDPNPHCQPDYCALGDRNAKHCAFSHAYRQPNRYAYADTDRDRHTQPDSHTIRHLFSDTVTQPNEVCDTNSATLVHSDAFRDAHRHVDRYRAAAATATTPQDVYTAAYGHARAAAYGHARATAH